MAFLVGCARPQTFDLVQYQSHGLGSARINGPSDGLYDADELLRDNSPGPQQPGYLP